VAQGLDALVAEMFLLAGARVFLSAGSSHWGSSTVSRLVRQIEGSFDGM